MNKPLIKWVYGESGKVYSQFNQKRSLEMLFASINNVKKIYGNYFDYLLCHNCDINFKIDIPKFDQRNEYGTPDLDVAWKLHPPRIDINRYEICIDNDLMLNKRFDLLEEAIDKNIGIITQGLNYQHGNYQSQIQDGKSYNSGFFGLPIGLDLDAKIKEKQIAPLWMDRFDEQGILGAIFSEIEHIFVKLKVLPILTVSSKLLPENVYGYHFAGANYSVDYPCWDIYKKQYLYIL